MVNERHRESASLMAVISEWDKEENPSTTLKGHDIVTFHQIAGYPTGHSKLYRNEFLTYLYKHKRQLLINSLIQYAATGKKNQLFDLYKQYILKRVTVI